jgi:PAS domain
MSVTAKDGSGAGLAAFPVCDGAPDPERLPFTDPKIAAAYAYWRGKSAGRKLPRRGDIEPTEIPQLLRDIMLVDVLADGRYRYRLIGTGNTEAHGFSATGRYLDEVLPGDEYKAHVLGLYGECVRERRALYSECLFLSAQRAPARHTKVLFMPLSEDGTDVNMVFVVQVFHYIDPKTRERHFLDAPPYREITHILL